MERNLEVAQKALKYFELAEKLEGSRDWQAAIENYQLGVENLKQSGYLSERIEEIYSRIAEIQTIIDRKKQIQFEKTQDYKDRVEGEAYALIDGAKKLENDGFIQDAIKQYMAALTAFIKIGWTEQQLESIKSKTLSLAEIVDNQRVQEFKQQASNLPRVAFPVAEGGIQITESVSKFEEKKKKEQAIQDQAFNLLDDARDFEKRKQFNQAIQSYENAINLLDSIGWIDQTNNLRSVVKKLQEKISNAEQITTKQAVTLESQIDKEQKSPILEISEKGKKIRHYEEIKKKEQAIQARAFNLLETGNMFERNGNYEEAIKQFEKAVELFKSIEWHSYIQPVLNFIENVKQKRDNEQQALDLSKKRQENLKELQETIYMKNKEQFVQSNQVLQQKRQDFLKQRRTQVEREQEFFVLLNKADETLQNMANFDLAIHIYQQALDMVKDLGAGWDSQVSTIKTTMEHVKKLQEAQELKLLKNKQKFEEEKREELLFQKQIAEQLDKERTRLKQKELSQKAKQEDLKYLEKKKEEAFKYLDIAQTCIKQEELDKAIYAYQNVAILFSEIHWNDETALIDDSIGELEERKREKRLTRQRNLQKEVERKKEEREFQERILKELDIERQKIREKQIVLKEKESQIAIQEKRKEEAFKMIDIANDKLKQGDFDGAIENYHSAANIFVQIGWSEEVSLLENSIIEIENKKRDKSLTDLNEKKAQLEREKKEREFQAFVSRQASVEKERLKKKEIILREHEKELVFRENKKEKAFQKLDQAQKYIIEGEYDDAIEIYYEVINIFAIIQWNDEISRLQNAINDLERKKKQKELIRQKSREKELKQEIEYQEFIESIRLHKIQEKEFIRAKQEELLKKTDDATLIEVKQNKAFKMLEDADDMLKKKLFESSYEKYKNAIDILSEIGWSSPYLKVLKDTLQVIKQKQTEHEFSVKSAIEAEKKRKDEEFLFQLKLSDQMLDEQEKYKSKKIALRKKESLLEEMESKRLQSFKLLDDADTLLNQGKYEESINLYRKAEILLSEIQFPTASIRETIQKVRKKQEEDELTKIKTQEKELEEKQEEASFQRQIVEKMEHEKRRMMERKKAIRKREENAALMEKKRIKAFNILEEAKNFMKKGYYDKAIQYYRSAELLLNEIQFPTDSFRGLIAKVKTMEKDREILEKRKLEEHIARERAELESQDKLLDSTRKEKARLKLKELKLIKMEEKKVSLEKQRDNAFSILEKAEKKLKTNDYSGAIEFYRKAEVILNQINYPTDTIKEAILKVSKLKRSKELQQEREIQRELEHLEEEKQLKSIIERRQREQAEKKQAQLRALEERERMIQDQANHREAAYQLLESASKLLKGLMPDYDGAISMYIQARTILAENIGWEPEITHLTELIKDLQAEKAKMIQKKQLEEQLQIKRQQEYEAFQEEIRQRQVLLEKQKQEQERNYQELLQKRRNYGQVREEGLKLIEEGKNFAKKYEFSRAYQLFEAAITKFKKIGWNDEINYIQTEIKNTKIVENKLASERQQRQEIQKAMESQKALEKKKKQQEDKIKQVAVGEVERITSQVAEMIKNQKQLEEQRAREEQERVKNEAMDFGKKMSAMMQLKQDLIAEMTNTEELKKQKERDAEERKEKAQVDEIAKMIKEAAKKKDEK